jgi:hypothetical protein
MVAISKNRKFFNCLLLHYYKSKLAKKNYCRYIAITSSTYITDFSLEFFVKPMYTDYEIRHSLMKKKITFKSTHQNPLNQVKSKADSFLPFDYNSIFSNGSHLGWRVEVSQIIQKVNQLWFLRSLQCEFLIIKKFPEFNWNYLLPCSCI